MTRKRIVMMIAGLLVAAVAVAQEFVVRDRGGEVATVTNSGLDVNALSGGITIATEANLDAVEADVETAITHLAAIETAVEDATARDVTPVADTTGGCTFDRQISGAAVLERQLCAAACQLYGLWGYSLDATPVYIKLYNDTAANTDETDTPAAGPFMIPSNATASLGSGNNPIPLAAIGAAFSSALTYRVTTGGADNDTGALSSAEVFITACVKTS